MRTTTDKKENIIRIRLNDDMYSYLTRKSERNNSNISEYIRELIRRDMALKIF